MSHQRVQLKHSYLGLNLPKGATGKIVVISKNPVNTIVGVEFDHKFGFGTDLGGACKNGCGGWLDKRFLAPDDSIVKENSVKQSKKQPEQKPMQNKKITTKQTPKQKKKPTPKGKPLPPLKKSSKPTSIMKKTQISKKTATKNSAKGGDLNAKNNQVHDNLSRVRKRMR